MANASNSPASYFSRTQQLQRNIDEMSKKQIVESPMVQTPSTQKSPSPTPSIQKPATPRKKLNNKMFMQIGAVVVLVLVLLGGGVGMYLMSQSQDTRQQASTPTGTGRVFVDPRTSTLPAGPQQVAVKFNMGGEIPVDGVQIVVEITGTIPADLDFAENTSLQGMTFVNGTFSDIPNGKKLTIGYLASPGPFVTPILDVNLGTITFTAPTTGNMTVKFDPQLSKVIRNQTGDDILKTPTEVTTYTFGGSGGETSPTPSPASQTQTQSFLATLRGTSEIPANTSTASGTARVVFNPSANIFSLDATVSGLLKQNITGSHIHVGSASQSGEVIVDLGTNWSTNSGKLQLSIANQSFPATQSAALLSGNTYFNIHTTQYPNGEIRGQLIADAGVGGLPSPTPTPATTPSPIATVSATPIPLPVTGATENTLLLVMGGMALLATGAYFLKQG